MICKCIAFATEVKRWRDSGDLCPAFRQFRPSQGSISYPAMEAPHLAQGVTSQRPEPIWQLMLIRHRRRERILQVILAVSVYLSSGACIGLSPESFCVRRHEHPSSHRCPLHLPLPLARLPSAIYFGTRTSRDRLVIAATLNRHGCIPLPFISPDRRSPIMPHSLEPYPGGWLAHRWSLRC